MTQVVENQVVKRKRVTPSDKNMSLHDWFLDGIHRGLHKKSDCFDKAYDLRCEILEMDLGVRKENLLLEALKEQVIKEMDVEAEAERFNLLFNKLKK